MATSYLLALQLMLSTSIHSSFISLEFTSPNVLIESNLILAKDFAKLNKPNNPIYFSVLSQNRSPVLHFLVSFLWWVLGFCLGLVFFLHLLQFEFIFLYLTLQHGTPWSCWVPVQLLSLVSAGNSLFLAS